MNKQQSSHLFNAIVATPFGAMGIRTGGALVTELVYLPPDYAEKEAQDAVAALAAEQVLRYCADADFQFTLPLAKVGRC